jgi:hypothetical protein
MTNPAAADEAAPRAAAEPGAGSVLVPASLRTWFRVHCAIDVVAALPLLLFPQRILGLLGWTAIDPVATRLCGAALLGIGGASVLVERYGLPGYRALLSLKVIWSVAAIFALVRGLGVPVGLHRLLGDLDVVRDPAAPARTLRVARRHHLRTGQRRSAAGGRRASERRLRRRLIRRRSVDLRRRAGDAAGHRDDLG